MEWLMDEAVSTGNTGQASDTVEKETGVKE